MRSRLQYSSLIAAAGAALLLACDGGPNNALPGQGGDESGMGAGGRSSSGAGGVAPASGSAGGFCADLSTLPQQQGSLVGWLESSPIAASGSEGFVEPGASELQAFQSAFEQLLESGPTAANVSAFTALNYELIHFRDEGGAPFIVVQEKAPRRGGGTYVVNPQPGRDLWLEAPHADSDAGTLRQSASQLVSLGARALAITGSNRCANAQATSCDGKSGMCGGKLRVSDAAHYDNNYFTAAHKALRRLYPNAVAVSVHGMESSGAEAAVISDGTSSANTSSRSLAFRDALNARLGAGANRKAFSCNDPSDDGKYRTLCGTTNVQGRYDNGSGNACTAGSTASQNRFLHIEQDGALRSGQGEDLTGAALAEVVPCSLGGPGLLCTGAAVACN